MTQIPNIAIVASQQQYPQAAHLAEKLHIPLLSALSTDQYEFLLVYDNNAITLHKKNQILRVDFLAPSLLYRVKHMSLRKELLAKALGYTPIQRPVIIDATAGFGKDSFILAALGFEITLIERSPIVHALLQDALHRALSDPKVAPIVQRMHLLLTDANTYLPELAQTQRPEVIYLDPMFPAKQKTALAKKEMVFLQELLAPPADAEALFEVAISCATRRVVVKRPRLSDAISSKKPDFSLTGSSSRFDIYLT